MSDNIKLIIEIPTDLYEITKAKVDKNMAYAPLSVSIAHGIPLDIPGIKEKCDNINNIASHLPYPDHRLVQELLSAILGMLKGETT